MHGDEKVGEHPAIRTERLLLRPFSKADALAVQRLAGEKDVASTTLNIPHPYPDGLAERWITTHRESFERRESLVFAIMRRVDDTLVGTMSLQINQCHARAELAYWIGKPYWNSGYCTEAARAIVRYGFETLGLVRVFARHLTRNPASGRVMQKVGMVHEGRLRKHVRKWGQFEDLEVYGILRKEYTQGEEGWGVRSE